MEVGKTEVSKHIVTGAAINHCPIDFIQIKAGICAYISPVSVWLYSSESTPGYRVLYYAC